MQTLIQSCSADKNECSYIFSGLKLYVISLNYLVFFYISKATLYLLVHSDLSTSKEGKTVMDEKIDFFKDALLTVNVNKHPTLITLYCTTCHQTSTVIQDNIHEVLTYDFGRLSFLICKMGIIMTSTSIVVQILQTVE